MKHIKVLGIDLAKNVFQLHGTDAKGKCILRKKLGREKMAEFVANLPGCLIGIEASTAAHYWGRLFESMGHKVKMMAPQFVKPYVKSNKNDRNDAAGIAEAVTRPDMRFVPLKKIEQQDVLLSQVKNYDKEIANEANQNISCKEVMKIEGIGPLTASAVVATIGDATLFKNGREVSAWLGLVPKQHSSGNTIRLSGISKRGDRYVRTLLIHGARTVVKYCENKTDKRSIWLADKKRRSSYNVAAVALANKNARIIWAMLATGECYRKA